MTLRDIGRPISHFSTSLQDAQVVEHAEKVLSDLSQHESEAEDVKGNIYRMRMRPYRTLDNVIDGVVVTFEDISTYKDLLDALSISEGLWRGLVENAPMGIFIMIDKRFTYLNPEALRIFGVTSEKEMFEKAVVDWVAPDFQHIFNKQAEVLITDKMELSAIEQTWLKKQGSQLELVISATPIVYKKRDGALVFVREKLL